MIISTWFKCLVVDDLAFSTTMPALNCPVTSCAYKTEDVAATEIDNIRKGSTVTCTIAEISENGLEVSVGDNLKGFIKKNDLSRERADQKTDRYGVGDKVDATVTNIDKKTRKISLSIKAKEIEEEKKAMAEYGSSDSGASLGDILGAALAKKDEKSS